MARKLFIMAALISLVSLGQATPGLAATYNLTTVDYLGGQVEGSIRDTWRHNFSEAGSPYWDHTEFVAGGPSYTFTSNLSLWKIGNNGGGNYFPYRNLQDGVLNEDGSHTIAFDWTEANPDFFVKLPDDTIIRSTELTSLTYTARFVFQGTHYTLFDAEIIGLGNNVSNDVPFLFKMGLGNETGNTTYLQGRLSYFTLDYPYDPNAAATPIPGAVWLLGTGLLGLACVGWRRRN